MPWNGAIINFELIHKSQTSQQLSDLTSKKGQNKEDCISNFDKNLKWNGMDNSVNLTCSDMWLERYIANIASLDRWLATIRNNRIQWSLNLKNIAKHWPLWLNKKFVSLMMVNLKKRNLEKPCKTTRNDENILGNYKNQLKLVKNHNIKKHRQLWLKSK